MKKFLGVASILLFVLGASAAMLKAQQFPTNFPPRVSRIYSEEAQVLNPAQPDAPARTVPEGSVGYALNSLTRTTTTHADADIYDGKDMKSLVAPTTSAPATAPDGFREPAAYAEYKFSQIQDKAPATGQDGPQQNGIVGFDFISYYDTIVGFNFTYVNSNLFAGSADQFQTSSNGYFFSPYIAKNFDDWVNVGGSFTYGRTDSTFRTSVIPVLQDTTQDSYALSPFVGLAHTWGAFSFSSTPSYIWGYDHFSFGNIDFGSSTGLPPGDTKTLSQTLLWLNNFQYAVTDKLSLSVQVNMTHMLSTQQIATPGVPPLSTAQTWMTFGGRADYNFNKDGSVFAAFEHDAFNVTYADYRIRAGVTYNF